MNTTVIEKTKIKKGDKHIDVRSIIKGWRVKQQENINDSFVDDPVDPESDNEQDI